MDLTMRLDTSMSQRLEQKMILAPRMIQSMEILQLPIMALQERIEHELEENPVLELKEASADADKESGAEEDDASDTQKELVIDDNNDFEKDFDRLKAMNRDWSDHFNEESRPSVNRMSE